MASQPPNAQRVKNEPSPNTIVGGGPSSTDLEALRDLNATMDRTRWRAVSDVAQVVANYLRCHPRVEEVRYPGLKGDPLFKTASCTLVGGFGPLVSYCVAGEWHELRCEPDDAKRVVMELERTLM